MTTINEMYSYNPKAIDISGVSGSVTALQFPTGSVKLVRFKAAHDNVGSFFVGESPQDLHYEFRARDDSGWLPMSNLNELYYINQSGTVDFLAYFRLY